MGKKGIYLFATLGILWIFTPEMSAQVCGSGQVTYQDTIQCACSGALKPRYTCVGVTGLCATGFFNSCGSGCWFVTAGECLEGRRSREDDPIVAKQQVNTGSSRDYASLQQVSAKLPIGGFQPTADPSACEKAQQPFKNWLSEQAFKNWLSEKLKITSGGL